MKRLIKVIIGNHEWSVRRMKSEDMKHVMGFTWTIHRAIDLNDTLTEEELPYVIRHEVSHALLDTQGRCMQKKFSVEELCEFVAWNYEQIGAITEDIMKRLLSE